jgi:hypothetical protein
MNRLSIINPGIKRALSDKRKQLKKYFKQCPQALAYIEMLEASYGDYALGWAMQQQTNTLPPYLIPWTSTLPLTSPTTYGLTNSNTTWGINVLTNTSVTASTTYAFNLRFDTLPADKKFNVYIGNASQAVSGVTSSDSVAIPWNTQTYSGDTLFIQIGLEGIIASGSVWYTDPPTGMTNTNVTAFANVLIGDGMTVSMRRSSVGLIEICINGLYGTSSIITAPATLLPATSTTYNVIVGTRGGQTFRASFI